MRAKSKNKNIMSKIMLRERLKKYPRLLTIGYFSWQYSSLRAKAECISMEKLSGCQSEHTTPYIQPVLPSLKILKEISRSQDFEIKSQDFLHFLLKSHDFSPDFLNFARKFLRIMISEESKFQKGNWISRKSVRYDRSQYSKTLFWWMWWLN